MFSFQRLQEFIMKNSNSERYEINLFRLRDINKVVVTI